MKKISDIPNVKKYFNDENLAVQDVYKAKENYDVAYINPKLYEELFEEKYDWEKASKHISEYFSITLDKEKSTFELVGRGYADKQEDSTGIALNGNLGSGRAYFYREIFNIKGDKTILATSANPIYSNGKHCLSSAIKDAVISNILAEDFVIPSFQTLAILLTKENFDFIDEYLDENDEIKQEKFNLPCAIEVRVNKDKELYRISNSLINKDNYTKKDIEKLVKKLAIIEANKFCDRFLHGSWSLGNISPEGNLIDFDTASFVKGRFPQYSNTNKYKSNYFGYELEGQKIMIDTILDEVNMPELKSELEVLMDNTYIENLKIRFCDLIGLDYRIHYEKYQEYIDSLFETFNNLSRKFLPNYYATDVYSLDSDVTYLFDFSNFFQKFLVDNKKTLISTNLLFNHSKQLNYTKIGFIKEKVEEFFSQDLLSFEQTDSVVNDILDFVMEYNSFFKEFEKENDIKEVIYKQYIVNANRDYIYANKRVYGKLSYLYESRKIDLKTLNIIINALIKTNKRNNFKNENIIGLKLYKDYLTYFILADSYYKFVIEPYSNFEINFAKVFINDKELMMSHTCNENGRILVSQKIEFEKIVNVLEYNMAIKINGNEYNSDLFDNK